jgi:uncharacterized protein YdgA (DUF945 family)
MAAVSTILAGGALALGAVGAAMTYEGQRKAASQAEDAREEQRKMKAEAEKEAERKKKIALQMAQRGGFNSTIKTGGAGLDDGPIGKRRAILG